MKGDATNLDRFHDLVVPPPVPWWPPTPGLWIVIAVVAMVLLGLLLKAFFRWQADRYRREALALLEKAEPAMISPLLKRVAVTAWPREKTARLTGKEWLDFLDRSGGMNAFSKGPGAALETVVYNPAAVAEPGELRKLAGEWIRKHRRELAP